MTQTIIHPELAIARQNLPQLDLPERWTPLRDHPVQQAFMWHPARFKVCPAGRRSGKTEIEKRKAILRLLMPASGANPAPAKVLLGAPTFGQARIIFWDDLQLLMPKAWIAKDGISKSRLEITTKWGAMIRIFGFDRPQRMEGVPWDHIGIDEIADCPKGVFAKHLRPALATRDREGTCDLTGVPDEVGKNQIEHEELYLTGLQWPQKDPTLCSFHWESADVLNPDEIKNLMTSLDDHSFNQEMGGKFVSSQGKAFPSFNQAFHVSEAYSAYHNQLPLDWILDFGVTPAVSIIGQTYRGYVWILDEVVIEKSGSTETQCEVFYDIVRQRGYSLDRLRIYGDATNTPGSARGDSDWQILEESMRLNRINPEWCQSKRNPLIPDTVNAVRQRLRTMDGMVHLHVNPRCKLLIENLRTAPWYDKLKDYHALAALRYYCHSLYGDAVGTISRSRVGLRRFGGR